MAESERLDDIQRIKKPLRCPRCGMKIEFEDGERMACPDCGEIYFDPWLGIYRIIRQEIEED